MRNNFIHMVGPIFIFLCVAFSFMLVIFCYRKCGGGVFNKISLSLENCLLRTNFMKLCFVFAALYLTVFILLQHRGIRCKDLDKAAQCQCYALEVANHEDMKQKVRWAQDGLQVCPDSKFFSSFLNAHEGLEKQRELFEHKKQTAPIEISLVDANGVELKTRSGHCAQLIDLLADGEHFISVSNLQLTKGFHYFVFEAMPTQTQLYVYMLGEKTSLLFPWLNRPAGSSDWTQFGAVVSLKPIFSQKETSGESEKLKIVVYSPVDQKIQLRWQHGQAGGTIYKGTGNNASSLCKVQSGQFI